MRMENEFTEKAESSLKELKLVASGEAIQNEQPKSPADLQRSNFFKSIEWSADGTCIITNSEDNHIRTYVVPPDLLEQRLNPHELVPYSTIPSFDPVNTLACYTHFDLQNPSTTLVLSASNEHPIRLNSILTGDRVASYPLVSPTTEAYIRPHSLLFLGDDRTFVAGSNNLLSFFDLARPGQPPITSLKTGPKNSRGAWSNPGTRLNGIVSALAADDQFNILAAGTLSRRIGLYDSAGQGECIGVFSVAGTHADREIGGSGITQVFWSKCGRYLHIAERKSDGAMVYDIRNSGQLLSWITGRNASSNQRMKLDLLESSNGQGAEIWAGGSDGSLRFWEDIHDQVGSIGPARVYQAHNELANSVAFHTSGTVLATTSGQRTFSDSSEDKDEISDDSSPKKSTLKIWAF